MPRPQKHTVDYFSHDANASEGRTLSILFNLFGHEGISCWWQLLEKISSTRNHVIGLRNGEDLEYLAAKLHFKPERLQEILTKLADLDAIDKELFRHGFIWSQNFVDRMSSVYRTRNQDLPSKPELSGKETKLSGKETKFLKPESTQTKLNYTKLNYILPNFIDKELWNDYLEMRKKKRASPTDKAVQLVLKDLEQFRADGDDPNEILKQSIINNWTGVFPLKNNKKTKQLPDTKTLKEAWGR